MTEDIQTTLQTAARVLELSAKATEGPWGWMDWSRDGGDDLDTLSGGRNGQIAVLTAFHDARTVVCKDNTGNMRLAGDMSLDNTADSITLMYDGAVWRELARADNAA